MSKRPLSIHSIYAGQPQTLTDAQGTWRSSIYRARVDGPVKVETRGLAGDRATQPNHGGPDSALCCHLMDHYRFWNARYEMELQPGNVGENLTLENADEDAICIGDIYRMGTVTVQVSGPRTPCAIQARRIGREDWVQLTIQELRTGFYLRVLEPGVTEAGDAWQLRERLNPGATITVVNRCLYRECDAEQAQRFATMPGLAPYFQERFAAKLKEIS